MEGFTGRTAGASHNSEILERLKRDAFPMIAAGHGFANKTLCGLLIILGLDALSLVAVLNYVAIAELSIEMGLVLFILAVLMLVAGYALGIVVAGFLAMVVLARIVNRAEPSVLEAPK